MFRFVVSYHFGTKVSVTSADYSDPWECQDALDGLLLKLNDGGVNSDPFRASGRVEVKSPSAGWVPHADEWTENAEADRRDFAAFLDSLVIKGDK